MPAQTLTNTSPAEATLIKTHQSAESGRVDLCCPHCKGAFDRSDAENWRCRGCDRRFPVDGGIPDLRTFETYYGSHEHERPVIKVLLDAYPNATFADLVKLRFGPTYTLPEDLRAMYAEYRLQNVTRGATRLVEAQNYLGRASKSLPETGAALEVGSGSGGMVVTLAGRFPAVAGVDINMADMVLAKKLVEEQGLANVTLACACAEALPFHSDSFRFIEALDVIEHVDSQATMLAEVYRTLKPQGVFWFTSPNRYHLLGPECHVKVWGVGFVPRRFQNAYVKWRKGVEYKGKRLLSRFELIKLLHQAGIRDYALVEPDPLINLSRPARSRWGRALRGSMPWLASFVNKGTPYFGSEFRVVVEK